MIPNYVKGEGPYDANLWLIGEAPGRDENLSGRPFVGAAGRMLDRGLKAAGINRIGVRLDNVFKRQPPNNKVDYYFKDSKQLIPTEEGEQYIEELRRDLELHRPSLVVALGRTPLYILTGHKRISKWRGSVIPATIVEGLKVYACYHPSFVMRMMQEKGSYGYKQVKTKHEMNVFPIFVRDLQRALEQSAFPFILKKERNFILPTRLTEVITYIENIPRGSYTAVDIETIKGTGVITRIGLAHSEDEAISIPFIQNSNFCWTSGEFKLILLCLEKFFEDKDKKKIFHNAMFDLTYLAHYWKLVPHPKSIEDTMILQHATYPHFPKGLDFCTSAYTWEPYYKDEGKQHGVRVGDDALSIYNCKDVCVTREIFPIIRRDCQNLGMYQGYERSLSYLPSLQAMSLRGVRCDLEKKESLKEEFTKKVAEAEAEITKIMGRSYQISSAYTKDLAQLLYIDRGLPVQKKQGKITTDAAAIRKLGYMFPDDPIPRLVITIRKYLKLISTYANMEVHADGRIRTTYDPTGTTTWRLSSYGSNLGGGGNLQNISRHPDAFTGIDAGIEIRKLFVPDEGKVMIAADFVQAEAMMVAWLAQEIIEMEAFKNNKDVHWINTKDILGLPQDLEYDSHNKDLKNKRNMGKTTKHASNYDMGPNKLQSELLRFGFDISSEDCVMMLERIRHSRPMIQKWKAEIRHIANTTRSLVTPLGRKRIFYGRTSDDLYRKMYAFLPQSTVGELTCMGIRDSYEELEIKRDLADLLLNVHDEIVVQCNPSEVDEVCALIKKSMEREMIINGEPLIIPVDFKKGYSWGELDDYHPSL